MQKSVFVCGVCSNIGYHIVQSDESDISLPKLTNYKRHVTSYSRHSQ